MSIDDRYVDHISGHRENHASLCHTSARPRLHDMDVSIACVRVFGASAAMPTQFSTPFPLPSREYFIRRKLHQLPPLVPGGPRPFLKTERVLDASAAEMQAAPAKSGGYAARDGFI